MSDLSAISVLMRSANNDADIEPPAIAAQASYPNDDIKAKTIFPCVQILMGTYNGEKFIRQQLDSILRQTYPNWELLIRDDGSNDNTMDILRTYKCRYPNRIKIVEDNDGNLGGFSENFHRLCTLSSRPIISFADQDDIWRPKKLAMSVAAIGELQKEHGEDVPLLVHHDFTQINTKDRILCKSFAMANGGFEAVSAGFKFPFSNDVPRLSMTVNRPLLDVSLPFSENAMGHEGILGCLASQIGMVKFIPQQLAHYRKQNGSIADFSKTLSSIFAAKKNLEQQQACARSYLNTYGVVMSDEQRDDFKRFINLDDLPLPEKKAVLYQQYGLSLKSKLVVALAL